MAIGLGCSLGARRRTLDRAVRKLSVRPGMVLRRVSRWYRTPPLAGGTAVGWFLNGVALFESSLDPSALLRICKELERGAGRRREKHWGDRTLDLDLLLADGTVRQDEDLILPHPAIGQRPFVLVPLLEVWPDAVDPRTGGRWSDAPRPAGPTPVPIGIHERPMVGLGEVARRP